MFRIPRETLLWGLRSPCERRVPLSLVKCISERYGFGSVPGWRRGSPARARLWTTPLPWVRTRDLCGASAHKGPAGGRGKGECREANRFGSAHRLGAGCSLRHLGVCEFCQGRKRSSKALALQQSSGHPRTSSDAAAIHPPTSPQAGEQDFLPTSPPSVPPPCPPSWIRLRESPARSRGQGSELEPEVWLQPSPQTGPWLHTAPLPGELPLPGS